MRIFSALLLLLCLSKSTIGVDEANLQGAWLLDSVKWTDAPPDINPNLQSGPASVLYFGQDLTFALIDCIVNRVSGDYEVISHGEPQNVYRGKWEIKGNDIAVEYRLVSRTVKVNGERLPGPVRHATIRIFRKVLHLNGNTFQRSVLLDKSAAEIAGDFH
jgi:hypothetical protein